MKDGWWKGKQRSRGFKGRRKIRKGGKVPRDAQSLKFVASVRALRNSCLTWQLRRALVAALYDVGDLGAL